MVLRKVFQSKFKIQERIFAKLTASTRKVSFHKICLQFRSIMDRILSPNYRSSRRGLIPPPSFVVSQTFVNIASLGDRAWSRLKCHLSSRTFHPNSHGAGENASRGARSGGSSSSSNNGSAA